MDKVTYTALQQRNDARKKELVDYALKTGNKKLFKQLTGSRGRRKVRRMYYRVGKLIWEVENETTVLDDNW